MLRNVTVAVLLGLLVRICLSEGTPESVQQSIIHSIRSLISPFFAEDSEAAMNRPWNATDVSLYSLDSIWFSCGMVASLIAFHRLSHKQFERQAWHCRKCGYLLYRLTVPRCPECGMPCESPDASDAAIGEGADRRPQDGWPVLARCTRWRIILPACVALVCAVVLHFVLNFGTYSGFGWAFTYLRVPFDNMMIALEKPLGITTSPDGFLFRNKFWSVIAVPPLILGLALYHALSHRHRRACIKCPLFEVK